MAVADVGAQAVTSWPPCRALKLPLRAFAAVYKMTQLCMPSLQHSIRSTLEYREIHLAVHHTGWLSSCGRVRMGAVKAYIVLAMSSWASMRSRQVTICTGASSTAGPRIAPGLHILPCQLPRHCSTCKTASYSSVVRNIGTLCRPHGVHTLRKAALEAFPYAVTDVSLSNKIQYALESCAELCLSRKATHLYHVCRRCPH